MRSYRPTAVAFATVFTVVLLTTAAAITLLLIDNAEHRSETLSEAETAASAAHSATAPPSATPLPPAAAATPEPPPTDPPAAAATPEPPPVVPPTPTPHAQPTPTPRDRIDDDFASRVLALINAERTSRGIPALQNSSALVRSAQSYARTLLQLEELGHDGDGTSLSDRVAAAGYDGGPPLGEVLWGSTGYLPPERVVADWMASKSHRQMILDPTYSLAGVGCAFSDGDRLKARCVMDLAG